MALKHKAGTSQPVLTDEQTTIDDSVSKTLIIEGRVADLETLDLSIEEVAARYIPEGFAFERQTLAPSGNGLGKLTVQATRIADDEEASSSPNRTTFRISMEAVTYDLIDHPHIRGSADICAMWLATDEAERARGGAYFYKDMTGSLQPMPAGVGKEFCEAYMAGIKTFNRYFPVLERVTYWDNPPGLRKDGATYTGGTFSQFSTAGSYEPPPLQIAGCPAANWYKSGDDWTQGEGREWTRTEQWTYTPESSSGAHAWIYED